MSVYKAIIAVQAELAKEGISKDRTNTQGAGYKFRGIDDVYNALAPLLATHGLCILPRILSRECVERISKQGGALFYTTVEAEFDFVSSEDGSKHTVRTFGEAMDSGDKSTNKAMSAAYKYAAFQAFCIPTEADNDADASTHEVKPATKPQTRSEAQLPTGKDAEYIDRVKTALKAIYGDDKQAALAKVEELTSFVPKGKTEADRVKGIRDFTKLTGDRLKYLAHGLERLVPAAAICNECRQPLVNGACRSTTCPEGRPE